MLARKLKTLIFTLPFLALSFSTFSAFAAEDPCDEIAGNWSGSYTLVYEESTTCNWQVSAEGARFGTTVSLSLYLHNGSSPTGATCEDVNIPLTGQCSNAQLNLNGPAGSTFSGTIINNQINLNGGNTSSKITIQLNKQII